MFLLVLSSSFRNALHFAVITDSRFETNYVMFSILMFAVLELIRAKAY